MAENGLSNQLETYPPKKYFYIKEQEWPEHYCLKNPISIPTMDRTMAFLGPPPKEEDLPDWLREKEPTEKEYKKWLKEQDLKFFIDFPTEKEFQTWIDNLEEEGNFPPSEEEYQRFLRTIREGQQKIIKKEKREESTEKSELEKVFDEIGETYTLAFDLLGCSGKFLSHAEFRLWFILRKRVPNKDLHGYYKKPIIGISLRQIGKWMGITERHTKRLIKKLEKKNLIRVDRYPGEKLRIWLFDLKRVLRIEKDRAKGIETGRVRSIIAPQSEINKAISYVKSKIK